MTETLSIEIDMPDFMNLMDANAKKQVIEEASGKIRKQMTTLFEKTSREIIARKLNITYPYGSPAPQPEAEPEGEFGEESAPTLTEEKSPAIFVDKADLAEEILSLPEAEALRTLKLSLAKGDIDQSTFDELKSLIEPISDSRSSSSTAICPRCGKELEPTVNFCRFCGAKVT